MGREVAVRRWGGRLVNLVLVIVVVLLVANTIDAPRGALPSRKGPGLSAAASWGYQLQKLDPAAIPSLLDVLVVDYSRDGSDAQALSSADVDRLRDRGAAGKRVVLAYLSIGEAERYRYYWRDSWSWWRPSWLGAENPRWKGNYPVRFWDPGWQSIIVAPERSLLRAGAERVGLAGTPYLDRILEAGFDGVYLDRVDVYSEWEKERTDAERAMVKLVQAISRYAKTRRPGFLVVPQNGEELLRLKAYRAAIDGAAKEDLVFGIEGDGKRNAKDDIKGSLAHLRRARKEGLPVLLVEYTQDATQQREVLELARAQHFVPLFARRALDKPPEPVPEAPASPVPGEPAATPAPNASKK